MKIAMLYELFWPSHGGIENWLYSVCRELSQRGHSVDLITGRLPDTPKEQIISSGFTVKRIDCGGVLQRKYISGCVNISRQLLWIPIASMWLRRYGHLYDIVHAHLQASLLATALAVEPRRLVWSWHGTYRQVLYEMYSLPRAVWYDLGERIAIRIPCAACVTADSYTTVVAREEIRGIRTCMIPVHNGVDCEMFYPASVEKPPEWGEGFHILTARRLVYKNGIQFLIQALPEIIRQRRDITLIIYGKGPMEISLRKLAEHLNIANNVRFMGVANHDDMPRLYNAADLIAIPSLMEASSLSVLEAMACGKPILTCPVGGIPEVAPEGCVVYAEPGNVESIRKQLQYMLFEMSDSERKEMGTLAREHVCRNFTWTRAVDRLERIYKQILNERKSVGSMGKQVF